jgi:hypothetical protein
MKKIILALVIFISCGKSPEVREFRSEIVDSVWSIGPGSPYAFQVDKIYFGKTRSGKITARKNYEIKVGDTIRIYKMVKQ